ncbi:MAG: TSUP family transporter, partial [Myxococcales bacterium]|nr:TSUP family transporter [Myxococcales bacterium]
LGTLLAAAVLTSISQRAFDLLFGTLVLVAVALAASGLSVSPSRGRAAAAGALSGFMGTTSSIGGPPMALLYQGQGGSRLRATLSGYFVLGALFSIAVLAAIGRYGADEVALTACLVPAVLAGFIASRWLRGYADRSGVRPLVLGLSACSAVAVLVRALA